MNVTQHRTQLLLDEDRYSWLRHRAVSEGKSLARIIRETVDVVRLQKQKSQEQKQQQIYKQILNLAGKGKRGPADVSVNHDKYLAEWIYNHKVKHG
jgi:hypothetical protein